RAYCLKTQPATGETYPKSDLFNKAALKLSREITEAITNFIIVTFWASESALTIVSAAGKKIKLFVIR
ncbi:hypothetical protein, partial [Klebsiella quasipneumoniae]|uniref:hypothetical protein n=1 Tax=Klebsiella quasipneumoniae TaxID=1463165 RepID=UPI0039B3C428